MTTARVAVAVVAAVLAALVGPSAAAPSGAAAGSDLLVEMAWYVGPPRGVDTETELLIHVTNRGTASADEVTLAVAAPPSVDVVETGVWGGLGTCAVTAAGVACDLGTLPGGSTGPERTVYLRIVPREAGTGLQVSATAASDAVEPTPDPHPNTAALTFDVAERAADLQPRVLRSTGPFVVGEGAPLAVLLSNGGPSPAVHSVLEVTVPATFRIVRADEGCSVAAQVVTCRAGSLRAGYSARWRIRVVPTAAGAASFAISARSATAEVDPDPTLNALTHQVVAVEPAVDLVLTTQPEPGDEVDGWMFVRTSVWNRGPAKAEDVVVTLTLPEGLDLDPSQQRCTAVARVVRCGVGTIRAGQAASPEVRVVPRRTGGSFDVGIEVTTSTPLVQPDTTPDTAVALIETAPRPPWLSGRLLRGDGSPTTDRTVSLFSATDTWIPSWRTGPALDGTYRFVGVPAGTYRLLVSGGAGPTQWGPTVVVDGEDDQTLPDLRLADGGSISGVLRGDGGPLLPDDVEVLAFRVGQQWVPEASVRPDASGRYTLVLPPADYQIRVVARPSSGLASVWLPGEVSRSRATTVRVEEDQVVTGQDLLVPTAGTLAGRVRTGSGEGVGGATIGVYASVDARVPSWSTTTSADGSFTIPGIVPGAHQVRIEAPTPSGPVVEWWRDASSRPAATAVVVTSGEATSLDVRVDAGT